MAAEVTPPRLARFVPAPRDITDVLLARLLEEATTNVEQHGPIGVTLSPVGWQSVNANIRDLALELQNARARLAAYADRPDRIDRPAVQTPVDWPVLVELVKLGVGPDQLERTYEAALDIAGRLELPTEHAAVIVGRVLALFGTPSAVPGVEAEGYRA